MTAARPPSPLAPPPVRHTLPAGQILHRLHAARFAGAGFNPCQGDPTRFAPIYRSDGACIPTLYAASSFDAAAYETVFHDVDPRARFRTIRREALLDRAHSRLELTGEVTLARLFRPELMRWRLRPDDLVRAPASAYAMTARWAEQIHADDAVVQGLIWTSNRCDPDTCVLLFGDRVPAGLIRVVERRDARAGGALLAELRDAAQRGGITITV